MIQSKLKSSYNTLTSSERKVADYILNYPDKVKAITSYELAKQLGIGQSTIIRFSQKLGYHSFRELLADVSSNSIEDLTREDIRFDETTQETNGKIVAQYVDIANLTLASNSPERIDRAVNWIKNANTVVCFGVGNSNLMAEYFSNQLVTIGINSISTTNSHITLSTIIRMKENDVIFLFSESGESKDIITAAKTAKRQGVKIVALTKSRKSNLQSCADLVLKTVNFEHANTLNATTIRCSQLCLIDMLTLNLYKTDVGKFEEKREKSQDLLKNYLHANRND